MALLLALAVPATNWCTFAGHYYSYIQEIYPPFSSPYVVPVLCTNLGSPICGLKAVSAVCCDWLQLIMPVPQG